MTSLTLLPIPTGPLASFARSAPRVLLQLTPRRLAALVMLFLASGVLVSILTTPATGWWKLHFSELGTVAGFSGYIFNGTLIATGMLIVLFAVAVHRDLRILAGVRKARGRRVLVGFKASVGVHLAAVGMIPVNLNPWLHDRAASGLMLSFLAILIIAVIRRRHVPKRLAIATGAVGLGLTTAITLFATGLLNLAGLEIIAFTLIFTWIGIFTGCLHRAVVSVSEGTHGAEEEYAAELNRVEPDQPVSGWSAATVESAPRRPSRPRLRRPTLSRPTRRPIPRSPLALRAATRPAARPRDRQGSLKSPPLRRRAVRLAAPAPPRRGCRASAAPAE